MTSDVDIQCFSGTERAKIYILSYLTGLRRKEIGSLTPRSFDLDSNPATVTVEAACSKHRRLDVLPLHPALVTMVREWIAGKGADEFLFPKLGKRRTWLMVKKDLERVGIPYETPEGIADFHAAGRHTHITELFRNGASVPEAKGLARHTDIRQTLKYTHIGLEDQACCRCPASAALGLQFGRLW
jgi:integrase